MVKKLVIVLSFCFLAQPAFSMQKMNKFFKIIKGKTLKLPSVYKHIIKAQYAPLWKKWTMGAVAGTLGYTAWNSNLFSASQAQEKSYENTIKTSDMPRAELLDQYTSNYETYLTADRFDQASESELEIMLEATVLCLQQGLCNEELAAIVTYKADLVRIKKEQRVAMTLGAIEGMHKASDIDPFMTILYHNYSHLSTEQRYSVIPAVITMIQQGKRLWPLSAIYEKSSTQEREQWGVALVKAAQEGVGISETIGAVYGESDAVERDRFLDFFISDLEQGDSLYLLRSSDIGWIYEKSTEEEQNKLFSGMMHALKNDYIIVRSTPLGNAITNNFFTKVIDSPAHRLIMSKSSLFDSNIYSALRTEHRDAVVDYIVDVTIIQNSSNKVGVNKTLNCIYHWMPHQAKMKLAKSLIDAVAAGKKVDFGFFIPYLKKEEKGAVAGYFVETLQQGYAIDLEKQRWLAELTAEELDNAGRDKLYTGIIDAIKKNGNTIKGLSFFGKKVVPSKYNILLNDMFNLIQQGYVLNRDDVVWLYEQYPHHSVERVTIIDTLVTQIEQGNLKYLQYFDAKNRMFGQLNVDQKSILDKGISGYFNWEMLEGTQTGGHLKENFVKVFTTYLGELEANNNQELINVIKKATHSEREYIQKKYILFYHAQMWNIYFKLLLYDSIAQAKYQSSGTYLNTRFMEDTTCEANALTVYDSKKLHKKLMRGRQEKSDRPPLVFTNMALGGNTTNWGSCTLGFLTKNDNITAFTINNCAIFDYFGKEAREFCREHQDKILAIEQEFQKLSKHGNLLQIAVPENVAAKYVYAARPGGYPKRYDFKGYSVLHLLGLNSKTDNIKKIADRLKHSPQSFVDSDRMEFVFPMTPYGMYKGRRDGIQFTSFNTADPEKLQDLMKQLQEVIEPLAAQWKLQKQLDPFACYKQHKKTFSQK